MLTQPIKTLLVSFSNSKRTNELGIKVNIYLVPASMTETFKEVQIHSEKIVKKKQWKSVVTHIYYTLTTVY